jgi:asparagine synthase (glutamine-hydrolysing)
MCAINGATENNKAAVSLMNECTKHRGPDGSRIWEGSGVTLGHNRLAIIDLSERALQPMQSNDGRFVLVFNGEIYNYRELRAELEPHYVFKTEGDSEVLLAGYALWGKAVLSRLKGIFAFGIWDERERSLTLVRDHLGVKPLYYALSGGHLYFSSELSSLIAVTGKRTLNHESLEHSLRINYVPSPGTLVSGIEKLPPAHLLTYRDGVSECERYWVPGIPVEREVVPSVTRDVIHESVGRQLVSDRPLGVLLSGGIDSSIVLHHASLHREKVRTFSVDFEMVHGSESEGDKFNTDARLAERTAERYGAEHTTFTLNLDMLGNEFESMLLSFDEPITNPTSLSRYLLSRFVRDAGVVVALGGDGGDELFGGYPRYRIALTASYYQRLPEVLQRAMGHLHPRLSKLQIPLGHPMHMQLMALKDEHLARVLATPLTLGYTKTFFQEYYRDARLEALTPLDRMMRIDRETWLADESLAQTDRTSMAHGLEVRVPLLDIDVVNYADEIPGHRKFGVLTNKRILREAYQGILPEYIFTQPKRGWISPGAKWLRDPRVHAFAKHVFSSSYYGGLEGVFNWDEVQAMLERHVEKKGYHLYPLWNILVLQVWARKYGITWKP